MAWPLSWGNHRAHIGHIAAVSQRQFAASQSLCIFFYRFGLASECCFLYPQADTFQKTAISGDQVAVSSGQMSPGTQFGGLTFLATVQHGKL